MSKQKGFTLVEGLLIVLILLIVGFAGYFVWNKSNDKDDNVQNTETSSQASVPEDVDETSEAKTEAEAPVEKNGSKIFVNEVTISDIVNVSDLNKLPDYTPAAFVSFMTTILEKNVATSDECSQNSYGISAISPYNIIGGASPVDAENEICAGGAPIIWILNPDGSWVEETRNGTVCKSSGGGLVYKEFAEECQLGDEWIANPNGSIFDSNI